MTKKTDTTNSNSKSNSENGENREAELGGLRQQIDGLDIKIQELISERVGVAHQVANVKLAAAKEGEEVSFYRPEREAQVLRKVKERNQGPLADDDIARMMREIMSVSLAAEKAMTIAYLGPAGTYTQEAVAKSFGHAANSMDVKTIADVFRVVEEGRAHFGVVPVENSTEGMISVTLDCLLNSELKVCGEVNLPIRHQLLSKADGMSKIKTVAAHSQALGQCRSWLSRYLPNVELKTTLSNAEAAIIASEDDSVAAIASEMAGKLYELKTIASGIEDEKDNTTRFLLIGKQDYDSSGDDKTSLVVSTKNEAGALFGLLKSFAEMGVDMSRIESRPSRKTNWSYVFFIDLIGHQYDEPLKTALAQVEKDALFFKLLGSYPRAAI